MDISELAYSTAGGGLLKTMQQKKKKEVFVEFILVKIRFALFIQCSTPLH
jgi:hypothetical protein